jgi:outer membrane protein OmpA-like peptidoglycan-associated protein
MRTRTSVASSVLAASVLLSSAASAQEPSIFDQPAQPPPAPPAGPAAGGWAQPGAPAQPGWGQPGPAQPGGAAQPGPAQPGPAQPAPQAAPGQFRGQAGFGAGAGFGAEASPRPGQWGGSFAGDARADAAAPEPRGEQAEWEERERSLIDQNNILGSTGLLRTSFAGSGAEGTFRVGFVTDWFSTSGFLCDPDETTEQGRPVTCGGNNREDEASHVGGFFSINATPLEFLEGYAQLRTYANSNSEGDPQLLQVLGDTTFGVKGFTPMKLAGFLTLGGELQLMFLNGTGDVGPTGGGTSAAIRALATGDFRRPGGRGFPLRANLNLGYKIDNSGEIVEEVEAARGRAAGEDHPVAISRIERYGLGINRVDQFQIYTGVEVPLDVVQPFLEYTVDIPVNRQGHECHTGTIARGDVCLGLTDLSTPNGDAAGFSYVPSRLSLGVRATPFEERFRGLSGLLAFDIGVTGNSQFVEEIAPQAPWTLYIGVGYAFDTHDPPQEKVAAPAAAAPAAEPQRIFVRGIVRERGRQEGIANAIVAFQGGVQPPVATGADGRFLSREVVPGSYVLEVTPPDAKQPSLCQAVVPPPPPAPVMPPPVPGQFRPAPPSGPLFVDVDCEVEAAPKLGTVVGGVKDAAGGTAVAGAVVKVTDALGKESNVTADGTGSFRLEGLPPGEVTVRVEADGYLTSVTTLEAKAGEETRAALSLNKRPKTQRVKVQGNEIRISDKILFETDSAKILGQSSALLEEIADVLRRNPNIQLVEIQGHTDNTGGREHNQRLSEARAAAVKDYLVKNGIEASRLTSKGYGQDRPLSPNVTEANKAKNRRVQFIIKKKK